ncbi:beta-galactosidase-1-like protein 2 isoform X2 [Paramormyrops kingsleyae]|uniref:Beta-galactosidase n=2 Tax=Paramormyrops kingsleyae TaxID=1676925 RepID=A0A3B3T4E1_9TELE|nr:beta-galactosidase-1-like protein 2 isoform X2 [Paramormyrops kingsleyae]
MAKNMRQGLTANSSQFTLNGEPIRILGGSIHYFRVPRAYWSDRLLKMKACGINTLTTYVPWNLHEPERGVFDFQGQQDLEAYIREAGRVGLWVILRPGPYICSEWELGGLPSWLLRDPNMKLRTTYPGFMKAVNSFFDELMPRVVPLQFHKGGPIIAVQVENEYGSYAKDDQCLPFIKEAMLSRGICELLLTSDAHDGFKCGGVNGALKTINFQKLTPEVRKHLEKMAPEKPKLVMEYWTGWFDVWAEPHHTFKAEEMVSIVTEILKLGMSINLYMFHGGTSFGFMNGATDLGTYKPQVNSYDYDAPLTEAGDYTTKYHLLRELFAGYHSEDLPEMPLETPKEAYPSVVIGQYLPLWESLQLIAPHESERPVNMENLPVNNGNGQSYGYTLYETNITGGGMLNSRNHVRDRALVFVDKRFIGILDYKTQELPIRNGQGEQKLSLLVENCGRVNYGEALDKQHKGLIGNIELNHVPLRDCTITSLEMKPGFVNRLSSLCWKPLGQETGLPAFFQGTLIVDGVPSDTFIKLPGWSKGVVFVNGQNLGRYWSIGPQQTLYLPGPWLKTGQNEIIVFEEQKKGNDIQSTCSPHLAKTS